MVLPNSTWLLLRLSQFLVCAASCKRAKYGLAALAPRNVSETGTGPCTDEERNSIANLWLRASGGRPTTAVECVNNRLGMGEGERIRMTRDGGEREARMQNEGLY